MNMILGKRQILLAALVLALSVAVYMNYVYGQKNNSVITSGEVSGEKNYGDNQFVSGQVEGELGEAYFAEAKLTRQQSRDEAMESLKNMLADASLSSEQKTELAAQAQQISSAIEAESKIENLIKAKGFEECMVYYDTEKIDVIVKTDGLLENQVAQMQDIIIQETNLPAENISIIEIK